MTVTLQKDKPLDELVESISGNVERPIKRAVIAYARNIVWKNSQYASSVGERIEIVEFSINENSNETGKKEAKVVCEIVVEEDMLNFGRNLHGGCSAFIVDICTSLCLAIDDIANGLKRNSGVSQAINMNYHSPASLGDKLRIISTTITMGKRVMTARCEIWNVTRHRIVASAVHSKMDPSTREAKL